MALENKATGTSIRAKRKEDAAAVADLESRAILPAKFSQKYLPDVPKGDNVRINLTETSGKWRFLV